MTDRARDRYRDNIEALQAQRREAADAPRVFFYLTDPESAQRIADVGFAESGIWSPQSTVTLLDRIPGDVGGGVLRVNLTAENTKDVLRHEVPDQGEGFRRFLVPMELLRNAYVSLITEQALDRKRREPGIQRDLLKDYPTPHDGE